MQSVVPTFTCGALVAIALGKTRQTMPEAAALPASARM
jgi:hypothetical protein